MQHSYSQRQFKGRLHRLMTVGVEIAIEVGSRQRAGHGYSALRLLCQGCDLLLQGCLGMGERGSECQRGEQWETAHEIRVRCDNASTGDRTTRVTVTVNVTGVASQTPQNQIGEKPEY